MLAYSITHVSCFCAVSGLMYRVNYVQTRKNGIDICASKVRLGNANSKRSKMIK